MRDARLEKHFWRKKRLFRSLALNKWEDGQYAQCIITLTIIPSHPSPCEWFVNQDAGKAGYQGRRPSDNIPRNLRDGRPDPSAMGETSGPQLQKSLRLWHLADAAHHWGLERNRLQMIRFWLCFRIAFTTGASFFIQRWPQNASTGDKAQGTMGRRKKRGEARLARLLLPAFLCAQIFIERERHLGMRQG